MPIVIPVPFGRMKTEEIRDDRSQHTVQQQKGSFTDGYIVYQGCCRAHFDHLRQGRKIDEAKQRAQVDYVIKGGVTGILAFGSNGEFYMLEEDEMERGLKIMVDQAAGRVPVYFGIGAISTKRAAVWQRWP